MDNNNDFSSLKQSVLDYYQTTELKNVLKINESEFTYPANVENIFKIEGKIPKEREFEVNEFKELLYDIIADKFGNEKATEFIKENFNVEIGLGEGTKFTSLNVMDETGKSFHLQHEPGSILMIDFWATWCKYCLQPMQENVEISQKNEIIFKEKNISIVGISCDDDVEAWKKKIAQSKWNTLKQYIRSGILKQVGIKGIPCIAILDKNGIIVYFGHPNSVNVEQTLISLAEGKNVVKKQGNDGEDDNDKNDSNPWWNELDQQSKMDIVAESNFVLKDAGVVNANFCVQTKFELDTNSNITKPLKTIPIFYGQVTQFEYESIQNVAVNLQSLYNFNNFAFNLKVMQISGNEDF